MNEPAVESIEGHDRFVVPASVSRAGEPAAVSHERHLIAETREMDMDAPDFGILAPNGDRFPSGVDDLPFHRVQRKVLGRHPDSDPRSEVVGRALERRGVRSCVGMRCEALPGA